MFGFLLVVILFHGEKASTIRKSQPNLAIQKTCLPPPPNNKKVRSNSFNPKKTRRNPHAMEKTPTHQIST